MMRPLLGALVSLGLFAACGSSYGGDDDNPSEPGTSSGSTLDGSVSNGRDATSNVDSGSGPFAEEEDLACDSRVANDAFITYVTPTGADAPGCGSREAPCKTVQGGITSGYATQKPKVAVAPGNYVEAITLNGSMIVEGGWDVSGTTWTPSCVATNANLVTIEAPATASTSVNVTMGASVLRYLTIKSKPTAAAGESLYGAIVTGPNVKLALDESHIIVAGGGPGMAGAPGSGVGSPNCTGFGDGLPGANGGPGNPAPQGTLSAGGFTPGLAAPGVAGEIGHMGTQATPTVIQAEHCDPNNACQRATRPVSSTPGFSGCGGEGGSGGKPGTSGGSSIGIIVASNALVVTYGGSVTTGPGGAGGAGGIGADGAAGKPGTAGAAGSYAKAPAGACPGVEAAPQCGNLTETIAGGPPGGLGGPGGKGGQGGGGAGGWSLGYAKLNGAALLASTTTVFTTTPGGAGGAPNGVAGLQQQQWP